MTEKDQGRKTTDSIATNIDSNKEIDKTTTAWEKLFSTFSTTALAQGVETTELEFEGAMDNNYFIKFHSPFSNDRLQPMIINLDVYDDNNEHVQRASGLAIWNEDRPEIISVNNHQMEVREKFFDLSELAKRASNIILSMEGLQTDDVTGLPINTIFPIPNKYLDSTQ